MGSKFAVFPNGIVLILALSAACSEEVEGPGPVLAEPDGANGGGDTLGPTVVCGEQLRTEVSLPGEGFAVLPQGLPGQPTAALPTITLTRSRTLDGSEVSEPEQVRFGGPLDAEGSNSIDEGGEPLVRWDTPERMSFVVAPELTFSDGSEGRLPAGLWNVRVANHSGNHAELQEALVVVDAPQLHALSPAIACLEQGGRTLSFGATGLLRVGSESPAAFVSGRDEPLAVELGECSAIDHASVDAALCQTGRVTLEAGALAAGPSTLHVVNPSEAACRSEPLEIRVLDRPRVEAVSPPLKTLDTQPHPFTVEGSGFLRIDGRPPLLTIGDQDVEVASMQECETLESGDHSVERCTELTLMLTAEDLETGVHSVSVANQDDASDGSGCIATLQDALHIVDPPRLDTLDTPLLCVDDGGQRLTLQGTGFLVVDDVPPQIEIDGTAVEASAVMASDCTAVTAGRLSVMQCSQLEVSLPASVAATGAAEVSVQNPAPAGGVDMRMDRLRVVAAPRVDATQPGLTCTDGGGRQITITGTGFVTLDGELPTVRLNGMSFPVEQTSNCTDLAIPGLSAQSCNTLRVTATAGSLAPGNPLVEVENPSAVGCAGRSADALTVAPRLQLLSVSPANVCQGTTGTLGVELSGTGFLRIDGNEPSLTVDGASIAPDALLDCAPLAVAGHTVESCTRLQATLTPTSLLGGSAGDVSVAVQNPMPSGCGLSTSTMFRVGDPPSIDAAGVSPTNLCEGLPATLTVRGQNLAPGLTVIADNGSEAVEADSVSFVDTTEVSASFSSLPLGDFSIRVEANAGCGDTEADAVTVHPTPRVYFVDPPLAYVGIKTPATVFATQMTADPMRVELVGSAAGAVDITPSSPGPRPGRIHAVVPDGLATGSYDLRVVSSLGCEGTAEDALSVVDGGELALTGVTPAHAAASSRTPLRLTAKASAELGAGEVNFASTPRVYLNPSPASTSDVAVALRGATFVSATEVASTLADGTLSPGAYDIIAINPDGEVGLLSAGLNIGTGAPPRVDSVTPAALVQDVPDQTLTLGGSGFDNSAGFTVQLECPGASAPLVGAASGLTSTSVDVLFPDPSSVGLGAGDRCRLRVANGTDPTSDPYFDYSTVSIASASGRPANWVVDGALESPRRAPAVVSVRPSPYSHYLYALGGDSGVASDAFEVGTAFSSVESARIDPLGDLRQWFMRRDGLPQPRTHAGVARVGRYVYLVGGHDGSGTSPATDSILRAQVLDPVATPDLVDLEVALGDGSSGLPAGQWVYSVASKYPASDPHNPNGESLPSAALSVQVPALAENLVLTLLFSTDPDASGYRVFRSPSAGSSSMELLFDFDLSSLPAHCALGSGLVSCTDGGAATSAGQAPLLPGALGPFHEAETRLSTAREGMAAVALPDPDAGGRYFLYAFGGRDGSGAPLDSYEYARVIVAADGSHSLSAFTEVAAGLSSARAELGAWVFTTGNALAPAAGDGWIYVGPGRGVGALEGAFEAAQLDRSGSSNTGALTAFSARPLAESPNAAAGYAAFAANNRFFLLTGGSGSPSAGGEVGRLCDDPTGTTCALPEVLGLSTTFSTGGNTDARIYAGYTHDSALLYLVGGHDGAAALGSTTGSVQ